MSVQYMEQSSSSVGNVYLVISDLHDYYKTKPNRFDYVKEIEHVKNYINILIEKYKNLGYDVNLLFLGDIYDRSYRNIEKGIQGYTGLEKLCKSVKASFVCVGNHEFTYSNSNPFWHLVKTIDSDTIKSYKGGRWKAKGDFNHLTICDKLIDGNVEILFNHYGCGIQDGSSDKTTIGLFHQDIYFKEILEDAKIKNREIFEVCAEEASKQFSTVYMDNNNLLQRYQYAFFGHNHLLYGKWFNDDYNLYLYYLASLGRTNHKEVLNSFLERDIPAIIIKDGNLVEIQSNLFNLMRREDCVKEDVVEKAQEKYKTRKYRTFTKTSESFDENPIESIKGYFNNPVVDDIIDEIMSNDVDEFYLELASKI